MVTAPCPFCGFPFDLESLGKYGCPNCLGEGLEGGGCTIWYTPSRVQKHVVHFLGEAENSNHGKGKGNKEKQMKTYVTIDLDLTKVQQEQVSERVKTFGGKLETVTDKSVWFFFPSEMKASEFRSALRFGLGIRSDLVQE